MQTGTGHQNYQDENFQEELRLQQATLYQPPAEEEEIEDEDAEFERDSEYDAARLLPNAASDQIQSSNPVQGLVPSNEQSAHHDTATNAEEGEATGEEVSSSIDQLGNPAIHQDLSQIFGSRR